MKRHDLAIGNLETTFSGKKVLGVPGKRKKCNCPEERRHPRTGFPLFNCPDELAATLRKTGFHVLATANNHCLDGGTAGLKRTLSVLDRHGLRHAGTYRSAGEARRHLVVPVKGIRIGFLAYTKGTNSIPIPNSWIVGRMSERKIAADIRALKNKADFIIVYLHFGQEYRTYPNSKEKRLMHRLFKRGANVVLGAHPHVLHPVAVTKMKDIYGRVRTRVAASSLGNFVSTKLVRNPKTVRGTILSLTLTRNKDGVTDVTGVSRIPTVVKWNRARKTDYRVVPADGR